MQPFDLDRFVTAQEPVYPAVVTELRAGRKHTHWMWFVFPQLRELGRSETAVFYGLDGPAEARAYFAHDVLGARLRECTRIVADLPPGATALGIFGATDAMKFRSCMTLFELVGQDAEVFADALDRYFEGVRDARTIEIVTR